MSKDSDELFADAVDSITRITGCPKLDASGLVTAIAAYIARFNVEIQSRCGPAHDFAVSQGIV